MRYKEPSASESKLITKTLSKDEIPTAGMPENLKFAAAVAEFGMILRKSEFKGSASYNQVLELANASKGSNSYGYRAEFIKLVEKAELLDESTGTGIQFKGANQNPNQVR